MAGRGGKWRRYYDWRELPMRMRVTRRVATGCGEVIATLLCSALNEQCTSAEVQLPGRRMRTPLRMRLPASVRTAMHKADAAIDEIRRRCGTRRRKD